MTTYYVCPCGIEARYLETSNPDQWSHDFRGPDGEQMKEQHNAHYPIGKNDKPEEWYILPFEVVG